MIFTRKPDSVMRAVSRSPVPRDGPAALIISVIGADMVVTGNVETNGELRIDGDVQGDVYAARIVLGGQARVVGDLLADEIVIGGTVLGSIRGNSVTFRGGSHIEGDVLHRKLTVEHGAFFEGKSRRSEDPTGEQSG